MIQPFLGIGLVNPKSPTNVGSVMRAAGCYSVDKVLYTGGRYDRAAEFYTDTHQMASQIPLQHVDDLIAAVPTETRVVCVELVEGAQSLPLYEHAVNALYLFGPEDGSIDQHIIDRAHDVVYVPTVMCMNLAASVNVLLYDRLAKNGNCISDVEQVRASRDTNNRLRIKPD